METDTPPKKQGRPKVDPKKCKRVLELYEDGVTLGQIAVNQQLARATVARIVEEEYGYDFSKPEPPANPGPQSSGPPQSPPANEGPETEIDKTYREIAEIEGNDDQQHGDLTELEKARQIIIRSKKDLRAAEREFAGLVRGRSTADGEGADIPSLKKQLEAAENEAKSVLETMGYHVSKDGTPTTVEEAKELLKGQGYQIMDPRLSREEVEKEIEKIKEQMAVEWQEKLDAASEDRRIEAGENIIAVGIDRVCGLFEPIIGQALGAEVEKTVQRKRTAEEILAQARRMRAQTAPSPTTAPTPTPAPVVEDPNAPPASIPVHLIPIPKEQPKETAKGAKRGK